MPEPLITIVVPTYNRAHLLPATLRSLQEQENRKFEIIIVDDGSTDNTEEVVQPFLNAYTFYVKKENAERAAARNYGAILARGTYVNFFDSDDFALPNHTNEAARLIETHSQPQWFHLAYEWISSNGKVIRRENNRKGQTLNKTLATGNHLGCNGVFVRKDIFLQHLFDEDIHLSASEDYECWLRLAARYPLYYSNEITSQLIDHSERSVRTISGIKLIRRLETLLIKLQKDPVTIDHYGTAFSQIKADSYGYISLHLSNIKGWKLTSLKYLLKAVFCSVKVVFQKRFLVIFRNLFIKWD